MCKLYYLGFYLDNGVIFDKIGACFFTIDLFYDKNKLWKVHNLTAMDDT